ncbi:MAG: zinc ribbon domain-containing protein [Polyangiaceae bacterium]|nr:zinc ribbon domain-containing protein [Polyangiaceae bacterium]
MPLCNSCGADIDVGSRFCGECGAVVRAKTEQMGGSASKGKGGGAKTAKGQGPGKDGKKGDAVKPRVETKELDPVKTTLKGMPLDGVTDRPSPNKVPPSGEGRSEFQRLLEEVETGFDAILVAPDTIAPPKPSTPPGADDQGGTPTSENAFDQGQAEKLFYDLVIANAQPIRDFMIEIRLGEPHADWITYSEPAIRVILRSAEGMGHVELVTRLRTFLETLTAAKEGGGEIRGEAREKIIDAYSELIVFFPEAFALEAEANARETAIVAAVLAKVPQLHKVGLDRIQATGLASLGLFYVSRPKDIVDLTGIPPDVAVSVVEQFRDYRKRASSLSPLQGRLEERRALREAASGVMTAVRAYEAAPQGSPERRVQRRWRSLALAEMSLLLARLGDLARLKRLETLPYAARCAEVLSLLDEADRRERRSE